MLMYEHRLFIRYSLLCLSLQNSHGMHSGPQAFACLFCERTFKKKSNRDTHVHSHIGVRPYECTMCGESFSQQSNIKRHMKLLHNVKCPLCDEVLVDKVDLPAHFKLAHPHEKLKKGVMGIRNFKAEYVSLYNTGSSRTVPSFPTTHNLFFLLMTNRIS